jgi:hypothetical protein
MVSVSSAGELKISKSNWGGYLQKDNERNRQVLKPVTSFVLQEKTMVRPASVWAESRLP